MDRIPPVCGIVTLIYFRLAIELNCGLSIFNKRICYVMLCFVRSPYIKHSFNDLFQDNLDRPVRERQTILDCAEAEIMGSQ